jgi:hypothetical protein
MYWAGLPVDSKMKKGDTVTIKGEFKGRTFGRGKKPIHAIDNPFWIHTKAAAVADAEEEPAKVSEPDADGLQATLESLVKQHGIGKILSVLGEIT